MNPDNMLIAQPNSGDEAFEIMLESMRARFLSAICVDSVATLVPQVELEGSIEDQLVKPFSAFKFLYGFVLDGNTGTFNEQRASKYSASEFDIA